MIDVAPAAVIAKAAAFGYLPQDRADFLIGAHRLYSNVTQVEHTILTRSQPLSDASETVKRRLAAAVDLPGLAQLDGGTGGDGREGKDDFQGYCGLRRRQQSGARLSVRAQLVAAPARAAFAA